MKSSHEERQRMQRKTTKKRQMNNFQTVSNRSDATRIRFGWNVPKECHPIGWRETDRMEVTEVTSFAFMDVFTPHNHVWLIIYAY